MGERGWASSQSMQWLLIDWQRLRELVPAGSRISEGLIRNPKPPMHFAPPICCYSSTFGRPSNQARRTRSLLQRSDRARLPHQRQSSHISPCFRLPIGLSWQAVSVADIVSLACRIACFCLPWAFSFSLLPVFSLFGLCSFVNPVLLSVSPGHFKGPWNGKTDLC